MPQPVYVECRMRCDLDELWRLTQDPAQHERWDLRFTSIEYLGDGQPQRFSYRLGPIAGWGETAGDRDRADGGRASALRFGSHSTASPIEEGAGYWLYLPLGGDAGIRFLTRYDYEVRWGRAGVLVDRAVLRPLIGWATAWSFDRLRLWLERGVAPERSLRAALGAAAAAGLALAPRVPLVARFAAGAGALALVRDAPSARRCLREPPP